VLDEAAVVRDPSVLSVGADAGEQAVLHYPPTGDAVDQVSSWPYLVTHLLAEYELLPGGTDDFLMRILAHLRTAYGGILGADFGLSLGDLTGVTFHGPGVTWPANPDNAPWIDAWHAIDAEIGDRMGPAILGDDFWDDFSTGAYGPNLWMTVDESQGEWHVLLPTDQRGVARPQGALGDVGAIERD